MAEERTYWIGKGVVLIAGVKYSAGKEIPVKGVDEKTLAKWKENGDISNTPIAVNAEASDTKDRATIKELRAKVAELKGKLGKAKHGKCKECPKLKDKLKECEGVAQERSERIDELETDSQEKDALIEKLNAELEAATSPDKGK